MTAFLDNQNRKDKESTALAATLAMRSLLAAMLITGSSFGSPLLAQSAQIDSIKWCKDYDARYAVKGSEAVTGRSCESVDLKLQGLRPALADYGLGIYFLTANTITYDVLGHDTRPQRYGGQIPTFSSSTNISFVYDLSRLGFNPGSQLVSTSIVSYNSYFDLQPTGYNQNRATIYLPFYNNQIQLQAGLYQLEQNFMGTVIGQNPGQSVLGAAVTAASQLGMGPFVSRPGMDIRFSTPDLRLYNHFGIFRSGSPRGALQDFYDNRSSFNLFNVPGTTAAYINEIGYRILPTPETRNFWIRGGGIYNPSDYRRFDTGLQEDNWAVYLMADYQLTQRDAGRPGSGWYIRGSADYMNPTVSSIAYDAGVTLYTFGTFAGRPDDVFSVSYSTIHYSSFLVRRTSLTGVPVAKVANTYGISYAYKLSPGFYANARLSYVDNPVMAPDMPGALALNGGIFISF